MLAINEEAVGKLYEAYASVFPEYEEFWSGPAMEEADLFPSCHKAGWNH